MTAALVETFIFDKVQNKIQAFSFSLFFPLTFVTQRLKNQRKLIFWNPKARTLQIPKRKRNVSVSNGSKVRDDFTKGNSVIFWVFCPWAWILKTLCLFSLFVYKLWKWEEHKFKSLSFEFILEGNAIIHFKNYSKWQVLSHVKHFWVDLQTKMLDCFVTVNYKRNSKCWVQKNIKCS